MNKAWLIGVVAFAAFAVWFSRTYDPYGYRAQAYAPVLQPPRSITAAEIIAAYQANALRADSILKGNRVAVRGVVQRIDKDITGDPYVVLAPGVQCVFPREASLSRLSRGDDATLTGTLDGQMLGLVIVRGCSL